MRLSEVGSDARLARVCAACTCPCTGPCNMSTRDSTWDPPPPPLPLHTSSQGSLQGAARCPRMMAAGQGKLMGKAGAALPAFEYNCYNYGNRTTSKQWQPQHAHPLLHLDARLYGKQSNLGLTAASTSATRNLLDRPPDNALAWPIKRCSSRNVTPARLSLTSTNEHGRCL